MAQAVPAPRVLLRSIHQKTTKRLHISHHKYRFSFFPFTSFHSSVLPSFLPSFIHSFVLSFLSPIHLLKPSPLPSPPFPAPPAPPSSPPPYTARFDSASF